VIADLNRKRAANQVYVPIAVVHGRLGVAGDRSDRYVCGTLIEVPIGLFTVLDWPSPKASSQRVTDQSSMAILR